MVWVVAGSRDTVGSSRSRISGSNASVRAGQRCCCCPSESVEAGSRRRELTSCQSPTSFKLRSIRSHYPETGKTVTSWRGSSMFYRTLADRMLDVWKTVPARRRRSEGAASPVRPA